jgi:DNA-binding transcriptional ArsR family regulator
MASTAGPAGRRPGARMGRMTDARGWRGGMRITDPLVMRALAHPARIEIVEYLSDSGAAVSATEVAGRVGLSPSATSYHLRELAKFGLVEQAPSRGDGRERLWRAAGTGVHIDTDPSQGPDAQAAIHSLLDLYLNRDVARVRGWIERLDHEPAEWRDVSTLMGNRLLLTADELRELTGRIRELIEPYQLRDRRDSAPEGARKVSVSYMAFPEGGQPEM